MLHASLVTWLDEWDAFERLAQTRDKYLHWFLNAWIAAMGLLWVWQLVFVPKLHIVAGLLPFAVGLLARVLLSAGHVRATRIAFLVMGWLLVWCLPYFVNGVRSPVFLCSVLMIVATGWMLGRSAMIAIGLTTIAMGFAYAIAEAWGWYAPPAPPRTSGDFALVLGIAILLTLIAMEALLKSFQTSIRIEFRQQEELEAAKVRMRQLLSGLHDGVLLINEKAEVEYLNQRACDLFAIEETPAAVARQSTKAFFARIAPQFAHKEETLTALRRLLSENQSVTDIEVAMQDGRTIACNLTPLVSGGKSHGRVWHVRDISALANAHRKLEQANQQLAELSMTDGLTGLANRRAFDQCLQKEWDRARRTGSSIALMLMDVDWFKRYNDHYGHQGGDQCLQTVAKLLAERARRSSDFAARFGGEEFAIIISNASRDDALASAQALCKSLWELNLPHAQSPFGRVSISIGVGFLVPSQNRGPENVVGAADAALYQAKDAGRNQAVAAWTNLVA